jgi:hypothetical protein
MWLAGKALQGYCSRPDLDHLAMEAFAEHALRQADAVIAKGKAKP